jgi:hypothetical protein
VYVLIPERDKVIADEPGTPRQAKYAKKQPERSCICGRSVLMLTCTSQTRT